MSEIRTSISSKSPYYISKHRYLELKHFCLQYHEWERELNKINYFGSYGGEVRSTDISSPVEKTSELRQRYLDKMEMVEQACLEADGDIYEWLLRAVTDGVAYSYLRTDGIPCSRDYFYDRYRRLFYILSRVR